eukprot:TRINITY_DN2909_c0_g1_i1.p1 TRINITY_DN2909_c0_g1~~TRINITY_DN2909_c0_g1_i1.p1  ORF type:complete len:296 (+),score=59.11 TRINITY_DN2909_c0_g1_i1:107-994(+)
MAELLEQRKKRPRKASHPNLKKAAAETIEKIDALAEVGIISAEEAKIAKGKLRIGVMPIDGLLSTVDNLNTLGIITSDGTDSIKKELTTIHSQSTSVLESVPIAKSVNTSYFLKDLEDTPIHSEPQLGKRQYPEHVNYPESPLTKLYDKFNPPGQQTHSEEGAPTVVGNSLYMAAIDDEEFNDGERLLESLVGSRLKMEAPLKGKAKRTKKKTVTSKDIDHSRMGEVVTSDFDFGFQGDAKISNEDDYGADDTDEMQVSTGPSRPPKFVLLPEAVIHTSSCKQVLDDRILASFNS